jgi:hypothetical protein
VKFMAAEPAATFQEAIEKEPQYVTIAVTLSGRDMRQVKRIIGEKFEVLEDASLLVRVKEKA